MRKAPALLIALLFAFAVHAQTPAPTPAPVTSTWALSASAVNVPGYGSSLAGAYTGVDLNITPNLSIEQTDLLTSAAQTNAYFGGVSYAIPAFSKWLDNKSPNLSGYDFLLAFHASAGASRVSDAAGNVKQHFAALFGGQLSYRIKGSTTWTLVGRIDDFNTPGVQHRNNLVITVGPTINF